MQTGKAPQFGAVAPSEMARLAEDAAVGKTKKHPQVTFVLAILSGLFIALAGMFYTIVTTGAGDLPYGMVKLVGGLSFSMGLMMVVLCGSELFTSNTLLLMGRATRRISVGQIAKNWTLVYFGNMAGSFFMVAMMMAVGQFKGAHGEIGINYMYIANGKMGHNFVEALLLGVLCNLVVCLTYWMTLSSRDAMGKMFACMLPVACFLAAGFEHSVANMFLLPMGYLIKSVATPEFWANTGYTAEYFSNINLHNMVFMNLIPATIGNIIGGGVMVGLSNWFVHLRE
ncbi:formate transporter FocA [Endozoicomonas gorgoniicola]|uniref:Formate transporter FocA n=1 Tax=Endozoicomonas gorgoniicola TaxID=1234144 RepID=A0ABT3N3N7_9GAMM|nr:formate transporter FocA [Endozoicomonas gorgoniicola]MCW7556250.1 formate transporter FocA [Endozoicomonas gorgoniicola]